MKAINSKIAHRYEVRRIGGASTRRLAWVALTMPEVVAALRELRHVEPESQFYAWDTKTDTRSSTGEVWESCGLTS